LEVKLFYVGERRLLRKTASGIMLTLLLTSMLGLIFSIQPVKSNGGNLNVWLLWDIPDEEHIRDLALGDFDGDGINDVAACVTRGVGANWSIIAIRGLDGSILWNFSLTDTVNQIESGNIDDDEFLDVIAGEMYGSYNLFALSGRNGSIIWRKPLGSGFSDIKVYDLNEDGSLEIIVAIKNQIIAFSRNGTQLWSFSANIKEPKISLGKFNEDDIYDIATITRINVNGTRASLFVIDGNTGSKLWDYALPIFNVTEAGPWGPYASTNDVTVGDFDGDSRDDIAIVVGLNGTQDDTTYRVYAFRGNSSVVIWNFTGIMPAFSAMLTSGDLNGDAISDVIRFGNYPVLALNGRDGSILWEYNETKETAVIFDFDDDGKKEVVMDYAIHSGSTGELILRLPRKEGEVSIGGVMQDCVRVGDITGDALADIVTGHNPSTGIRGFKVEPWTPPPTYSLTITTTDGGTTDPAPGTYSYTANSTVEVTAIPEANYLFDYWELDSVNIGSANPYTVLMDKNHTLKAVFSHAAPPLSASITPLSASILVGQSVTFTSTVSGGYTPYTYQWYLNDNPVSGANQSSWTFTPTEAGIYYVYLKITDDKGNTAQSETARITVATVPVGGYSYPINKYTLLTPIATHIALIAILTTIFITIKRKRKRKH